MRPIAAYGLLLTLVGCAAVPVVGGVGATGAIIAGVTGISTATLSEVSAAGCAAQAAANFAGMEAKRLGSAAWVAHFEQASKIAGFACAW